jgi:hypothetical protein
MGLLTELFVASDEEAKAYDHTTAGRFPRTQLGGLTNLEFETLWAILAAETWNLETHSLTEVASTKGSWTFRFPAAYIDRLRRLEPSAIVAAATCWAATEEIASAPSDVEPVISALVSLARSVKGPDQGLFLWSSL